MTVINKIKNKIAYKQILAIENLALDLPRTYNGIARYNSDNLGIYFTGGKDAFGYLDQLVKTSDFGSTQEELSPIDFLELISCDIFDDGTDIALFATGQNFGNVYKQTDTSGVWTNIQSNPFGIGGQSKYCLVSFLSKLWIIGYYDVTNTTYPADMPVYESADGITWVTNGNAQIPDRNAKPFVIGNKLWIMGGYNEDTTTDLTDVWSSTDATNWTEETEVDLTAYPMNITNKTIVDHNGEAWIYGGVKTDGTFNDKLFITTDFVNFDEYDFSASIDRQGMAGVSNGNQVFFMAGGEDPVDETADLSYIFGSVEIKDYNTTIEENLDYESDSENKLLWQYKGSETVKGFLHALSTNQVQEIESAAHKLYQKYDIDLSDGTQLDVIGELLNKKRENVSDAVYKVLLKGQAAANSSEGSFTDVYDVTKILTNASQIKIIPLYPATILIYINTGLLAEIQSEIFDIIQNSLSAGVELEGIGFVRESGWFGWNDDPTAEGFNVGLFDGKIKN